MDYQPQTTDALFTLKDLIGWIVGSAIVSVLLGWFVSNRQHKRDYKSEYHKKLLDKRINAYEEIEYFIARLKEYVALGSGGKVVNHFFFEGIECYNGFIATLTVPISKSFWLSNEVSEKLTQINTFLLNNVSNHIDDNASIQDQSKKLLELGLQHCESIRTFRKELQILLYNDLKSLHKIDDFIESFDHEGAFAVENKPDHLRKKEKWL